MVLDTLRYAKTLEGVGVSREQAEVHVQILSEMMDTHLASRQNMKDLQTTTQQEMKELRRELKQDMANLRVEFKQDIAELRAEMQQRFNDVELRFAKMDDRFIQLEQRMTIKLGTIVSIAIGVAVTLAKLVG